MQKTKEFGTKEVADFCQDVQGFAKSLILWVQSRQQSEVWRKLARASKADLNGWEIEVCLSDAWFDNRKEFASEWADFLICLLNRRLGFRFSEDEIKQIKKEVCSSW